MIVASNYMSQKNKRKKKKNRYYLNAQLSKYDFIRDLKIYMDGLLRHQLHNNPYYQHTCIRYAADYNMHNISLFSTVTLWKQNLRVLSRLTTVLEIRQFTRLAAISVSLLCYHIHT